MGSSIKINSISIDLAGATSEVDAGKCEHFSIRGFVAEIRQRDRAKCWPFSVDGANLEGQSYPLPSLSVPKSRWWRCTSCLKDINAEGINGGDCWLHANSRALREKKVDANMSIIPTKSDWNSPLSANEKELKADNAGKVSDGNENVNHVEGCRKEDQTGRYVKLLKKVQCTSNAVTVGNKSRKLANPEKASKKSREKVNISVEINLKENHEAVNGQMAEALTTFGSSEIAGVVDDTPKATEYHEDGRFLMELDECDNASSESAFMVRNLHDYSPDNMTGLQRRKTRKVRLLSELLGKSSTKGASNVRNEESPSKKELARGRKRKSSGDEEWKPPETTPENNYANRKLSTIDKTSENASQSCDSEGHVLSGTGSPPSVESQSTDSGFDEDPIKGKQKNRRFQVVDEHLPAVSRENSQKSAQENEGSPKCNPGKITFPCSVHSSSAGKELDPCPLHTQRAERKTSVAKKKSKRPPIDNNQSTMITFGNSMAGGNQIVARKSELLQTSSGNTVSKSVRDISNGKGFDHSLDKLLASEGYVRKHIPQLDDRPVFSFLSQDIGLRDDLVRPKDAETSYFRDFVSLSKSNADRCLRSGAYLDLSCSSKTSRSPFLKENLRHTPSTEVVDHSVVLQKDTSGAYSKGKGVLIQSDHRKEKTPEHIDDIPMEIVELMAKNQYERCLPDKEEDTSKNSKQPSQTTLSTPKNGLLIDLNKTYENGVSLEDNTSRQPKPRTKNMRKDEHVLTVKQNSDVFPINQFGHPYVPSGLGIFPLSQEKPSSSIQFSGAGSSGQSIHSCQWLGNAPAVASQSSSPSPFRVLRPCNTCQSVPQQYREASHPMWPSSMVPQNHMSVSFNMPQKLMDQSTKRDMLSRGSRNDLNSWNLNFLDNEKQKRGFASEFSFGCKHGGAGNRSANPYSSESSIPAMHLLSLMDPRLRSNTPADLPGNAKLSRKPFPHGHHSKEFLGLLPGDCSKTPNLTKQLAFDFYSKRSTDETSQKNFPVISAVGTSSFSFQSDKTPTKGADVTIQTSWNYPEKKTKTKDTVSPIYNSHQKSNFISSCDPGKFQLLGASDSMMLPLKFHTTDYAKKNTAKGQSCNASACPLKTNAGPIMCSMNRNPADFTIPEPANIYMIKGKDLKVRKRGSSKMKPSSCKQDASKQNKSAAGPATENV